MRRSAISTFIFVLVIAGGFIVYVKKGPRKHEAPSNATAVSGIALSAQRPEEQAAANTLPAAAPGATSTLSEPQALEQAVRSVVEHAKPDRNADQLIQDLARSGQEPVVARDRNEYTGEMIVIRTKNPLPGTRYFHAQFFSDDKGGSYPQHLSVEFRAGPDAFANVVGTLRKALPNAGEPSIVKEGFMQWELTDGYVAWVKQLGPSDVEDDGINPRTPADIGTIWLAVELAPHNDGETH